MVQFNDVVVIAGLGALFEWYSGSLKNPKLLIAIDIKKPSYGIWSRPCVQSERGCGIQGKSFNEWV